MMITKVGKIVLTKPIFVEEESMSSDILSQSVETINGGVIHYEIAKQVSAKTITLITTDTQWQDESVVNALIALANASLGGVPLTLKTDTPTYIDVIFNHDAGAVQFRRVFPLKHIKLYTGSLNFWRVVSDA